MKKYVCPVCGYVYEGDEMPADFHCPVCKAVSYTHLTLPTT